jgi:hypothetical protein
MWNLLLVHLEIVLVLVEDRWTSLKWKLISVYLGIVLIILDAPDGTPR